MDKNSEKYLKSPLYWTVICAIIDFKGGKKYPILSRCRSIVNRKTFEATCMICYNTINENRLTIKSQV